MINLNNPAANPWVKRRKPQSPPPFAKGNGASSKGKSIEAVTNSAPFTRQSPSADLYSVKSMPNRFTHEGAYAAKEALMGLRSAKADLINLGAISLENEINNRKNLRLSTSPFSRTIAAASEGSNFFDSISRGISETTLDTMLAAKPGARNAVELGKKALLNLSFNDITAKAFGLENTDALKRKTISDIQALNQKYNEDRQELSREALKYSQATQTFGQISNAAGRMIPSIAVSVAARNPNAGLAAMGGIASGGYMNEALNNGANVDEAYRTGLTKGAVEVLTEKMFGGVAGLGSGVVNRIAPKFASRILSAETKKVLNQFMRSNAGRFVKYLGNAGGEGVEEVAAEILSSYIDRGIYDPEAKNAALKDLSTAYGTGAILSLILGLPVMISGSRIRVDRSTGAGFIQNSGGQELGISEPLQGLQAGSGGNALVNRQIRPRNDAGSINEQYSYDSGINGTRQASSSGRLRVPYTGPKIETPPARASLMEGGKFGGEWIAGTEQADRGFLHVLRTKAAADSLFGTGAKRKSPAASGTSAAAGSRAAGSGATSKSSTAYGSIADYGNKAALNSAVPPGSSAASVSGVEHTSYIRPETVAKSIGPSYSRFANAVDDRVVSFARRTLLGKSDPKALFTISLTSGREAADVQRLIGLDVRTYRHSARPAAIKRTYKEHGFYGLKDDSMANVNDLGRLPYLLKEYDSVELMRKPDGTIETSAEFRNADGTSAPKLIYKKKIGQYEYTAEAAPDSGTHSIQLEKAYIQDQSLNRQTPEAAKSGEGTFLHNETGRLKAGQVSNRVQSQALAGRKTAAASNASEGRYDANQGNAPNGRYAADQGQKSGDARSAANRRTALMRSIEDSNFYEAYADYVVKEAGRNGIDVKGRMNQIASDLEDSGKPLNPIEIRREFVAEYGGNHLLKDAGMLQRMAKENPVLFKQIHGKVLDTGKQIGLNWKERQSTLETLQSYGEALEAVERVDGSGAVEKVADEAVGRGQLGREGESETNKTTSGKSRAPETGTPGSTYEQVDDKGNVMSRTKYGENGRPEYREDLTGRPHYDKNTGEYLEQHRHNFKYNDKGQPIGETVTPISD